MLITTVTKMYIGDKEYCVGDEIMAKILYGVPQKEKAIYGEIARIGADRMTVLYDNVRKVIKFENIIDIVAVW